MKNEQDKVVLEKGRAYFNAAVQMGEYLYYSAKDTNGLFRADLSTGKSEFITMFDTENETDIHIHAFSVNDEIWFIPSFWGDKIAVFNTESLNIKYIDIPETKTKKITAANGYLFLKLIRKGDFVWLVPGVYDAFLCLNLNNRELRKIDLPISDYEGINYLAAQGCEHNNKIYLCPWDYNKILSFDLETEEFKELGSTVEERVYRNIVVRENHLYLFPEKLPNDILDIDLNVNACVRKKIDIEDTSELNIVMYYDDRTNQVFLFPRLREKRIYVLDMGNFTMNQIEIEFDDSYNISDNAYWLVITKISEDTFCVISNDKMAPILKCHNHTFTSLSLACPKDLFVKQLLELMEKKEKEQEQKNEQETIGEKIFKAISSDTP